MESQFKKFFNNYLKTRFPPSSQSETKLLRKALLYTLKAPSSLFRPKVAWTVTQCLGHPPQDIFPWATAIELIHGASLIHDDLPCMDDSPQRRGKSSNHLVFGEDMALLAGSCLFVEAFSLLTLPIFKERNQEMLELLVQRTGFYGMMGGQAMDIRGKSISQSFLLKLFELKTGSLILAAVEGPALLWNHTEKERKALQKYGQFLGQAYQAADDLTDKSFSKPELYKKQALLKKLTRESIKSLKVLKFPTQPLAELSLLNEHRALKKIKKPQNSKRRGITLIGQSGSLKNNSGK